MPYYERFLAAFPTPAACAEAGPAAVVRLWSGLGYNRRALNLHRAAAAIVAEHSGAVPHEDEALRALPGVGTYTARAVRAFAFGDDVAAVDTNGVRVLARGVAGTPLTVRHAMDLGDRLVPAGGSWEFNQAMFDLGASVCTAARPDCTRCPLRRQCAWRRQGPERPDPWRLSPTARPQSTFAGSDRQGRGRLLDTLRAGGVRRSALAGALRLGRRQGAGRAGGGRRGGGGVRRVVRREGSRPPAAVGGSRRGKRRCLRTSSGRGQETDDVTVDDLGSLHVEEVAGIVDDLDRGALGHEVEGGAHGRRATCSCRRGRGDRASASVSGAVRRPARQPALAPGAKGRKGRGSNRSRPQSAQDGRWTPSPGRRPRRRRSPVTSRARGGR